MRPLNPIRFELKQRHTATVMKNGHIRVESHYYSVPCKYIGRKVNVLYNIKEIEVFLYYEKIAVHTRSFRPYGYTTSEEHLASQHRFMTDWNPNKFFTEAATVHPDVETYIRRVMKEKKHPEQVYKSCREI